MNDFDNEYEHELEQKAEQLDAMGWYDEWLGW